jgi:hypothetical protein
MMKAYLLSLAAVLSFSSALVAEEAPKNLLKPIDKAESWRFEQHEGAEGEMKVEEETVVFHVKKITGTDWHAQVFQSDLKLEEGKKYTFKFQMKSPERRGAIIQAGVDEEDYHEIGLREEIYAAPVEFKEYSYTFTATSVSKEKNRIGFVLGLEKGTTIIKGVSLTEAK